MKQYLPLRRQLPSLYMVLYPVKRLLACISAKLAGKAIPFALAAAFTLMLMPANPVKAQQAPDSFVIIQEDAAQLNQDNVPGFGNNYSSGNTYNLRFGQIPDGDGQGENLLLESFVLGGNTYAPVSPPISSATPYEYVIVNRVNNSAVDYDRITAFFSRSQTNPPTGDGSTLFFDPEYGASMESFLNSFIINRGSDNLFANANSATLNNVERLDFILNQSGVSTLNPPGVGFLLTERGGNDDYKIAAITELNPDGSVASLGTLVTGFAGSDWGNSDENILSTVFISVETGDPPLLRPSQNLTSQPIAGSFVSFDDLGISSNEVIYGFALFPGDVDETMDLIGLTDVPLDTDGAAASAGGLDLMAGGGFFAIDQDDVFFPDFADLSIEKVINDQNPNVGDVVTFTISVTNNGPEDATGVSVEDLIPPGFGSVSNISHGGSLSGNIITWSGLSIANGDSIDLTFDAEVLAP